MLHRQDITTDNRIENQKKKIKKLLNETKTMRNHHAELYKLPHATSFDMTSVSFVYKTLGDPPQANSILTSTTQQKRTNTFIY